ncbi:MAG: amidohydrolase/deacetylase family metallohydrolase [Balneolaceae bacterium]
MGRITLLLIGLGIGLASCQSDPDPVYDLLIDNGHVVDARNGVDQVMDVALLDGRIARVSPEIDPEQATQRIDATGLYVAPGLINPHGHYFTGPRIGADDGGFSGAFASGFSSVSPDNFTLRNGITTVVDAGTSGWRNVEQFKENVVDPSTTRVLAFLNIVGYGMLDHNHNQRVEDMDVERTVAALEEHDDWLVGTKIGHFYSPDWTPFERAQQAARESGTRLFVECHLPELPMGEILERLEEGDILTHIYGAVHDREHILNQEGRVRPDMIAARERGVFFDTGHGGVSFHYDLAAPALEQGFLPDAFGTDLHRFSMNAGMKNMLNVMSKFMNLGMDPSDLLSRATWGTAKMVGREDLGHLSEGAVADIAILNLKEGSFGFVDSGGERLQGDRIWEAEVTLREGRVVWDLNGLAARPWQEDDVQR